jgi:polysaccharide deacetylase family protein (PEP-CTERM system associated)
MSSMLSVTFALVLLKAGPQALVRMGGTREDSLLLMMLGIGLVLLSVLVRGLTELVHPDREGEDVGQSHIAESKYPIIEPLSVRTHGRAERVLLSPFRPLLSVDVEDYFQTEAFSAVAPRAEWERYSLRVVDNTKRLLDIFDTSDAKATFFMLGWVARKAPQLVREIAARGHELACHSYWHRTIYSLTPEVFRQDTRDALAAIEDASGMRVTGYRAPTWSITRKSLWAISVLAEEGFEYDSSVYPVRHDLYGIPGAMASPYIWKTDHNDLVEIPPATFSIGSMNLPAAGGGYLRIFPLAYSRMAIDKLARRGQLPVVYLHPWEIDPEQPRLNGPWKSQVRQYWGLDSFELKLERLLACYQFVPFCQRWRDVAATAPSIPFEMAEAAAAS